MANPSKGEYPFTFKDEDGNEHHFVFKFSNEGKRVTEEAAGMTRGEIMQALRFGEADSIKSALFWGATRKNHKRDFPVWPQSIDNFFDDVFDPAADEFEEAEGELPLQVDLFVTLTAAYQRIDKDVITRQILGEDDEDAGDAAEAPKGKGKQKEKAGVTEGP